MDFNRLYKNFCEEHFGGRYGLQMFEKLEEKIEDLKKKEKGIKIAYQQYDKENDSSLVIAIVTPFMCRVHRMVGCTLYFELLLR